MNTRLYTLVLIFTSLLSIFTISVFASQILVDEKSINDVPEFRLSSSLLFFGLVLALTVYIDLTRKIPFNFAILHKIEILASLWLSITAFNYLCKYNIIDYARFKDSHLPMLTIISMVVVFYSLFCAFINTPIFKFSSPWAMWRWMASEERKNKLKNIRGL